MIAATAAGISASQAGSPAAIMASTSFGKGSAKSPSEGPRSTRRPPSTKWR